MALIKRGKVWHIDIRRNGMVPYRISTGTGDKKLAAIKHADAERALLLGQELSRGPSTTSMGPTLKDAFDAALSLHWKGRPCVPTVADHRAHIFETIPPATRLGAIDTAKVQALVAALEGRGNGPSTINKKLHTLHTAMESARAFGLWKVAAAEVPKMPSFREPEGRIRVFTVGEEAAITAHFAAARPSMVWFVEAMIDTGLRLGELLDRPHLAHDRAARTVHVWETKGGPMRQRRLPLTVRADVALAAWLEQPNPRKAQVEWAWRNMRVALGHTGDAEFVIHTLRHTCCTRLVLAGMDLRRIQMWMGHKDINTTMRYANVRMDELAPLAAALEPTLVNPLEVRPC